MEFSKRALNITPSVTLSITAMESEMKAAGKDVIGFGAGEPDMDTPQYVKEAAKRAIDEGHTKYTAAAGTPELRRAVCDRLKRKYDLEYTLKQIVISNGAKHSLFNAFQAILNPGDEVLVFAPYWVTYPELVKMAGGVPVFVQTLAENNFEPREADVRAALSDKTAAMIVNNPSNPCGCVYCKKTLEMLAGIAKERDLHVIADEIYDELVYDGREYISFPTLSEDAYERTILVNGLSKAYAMTGWRMGYTASSLKTASIMASYQSHATSNPCSITQYAGIAAMTGPQDDLASMVAEFACRRDLLVEKINAMQGVHCRKPQGAFYVMMDISSVRGKAFHGKKIENSLDFAQILLESKHVALVPGAAFGADDFARLSYATSRKNIEEGCKRIAEFLEEIK